MQKRMAVAVQKFEATEWSVPIRRRPAAANRRPGRPTASGATRRVLHLGGTNLGATPGMLPLPHPLPGGACRSGSRPPVSLNAGGAQ